MIRTTTVAVLVSAALLGATPAFADDFYAEANPTLVKKEAPSNPDRGLSLGLRTGYALPFGKPYDSDVSMSNDLRGIVPIWVDAGYRINPSIYVGAYGAFGLGIVHTSDTQCTNGVSCSAYDVRIGINAQYHFRPKTDVDPWIGLGFGYEWLHYTASGFGVTFSQTLRGFEVIGLQVGTDFELATGFHMGPFIGYSIAKYSDGTVSRKDPLSNVSSSTSIANTAAHEWLTLGIRGVLDI
jgi:hypothetical protein